MMPFAVKNVGYSGSIARSPTSVLRTFPLLSRNDDEPISMRKVTKGAPSGKASDTRALTVRVNNAGRSGSTNHSDRRRKSIADCRKQTPAPAQTSVVNASPRRVHEAIAIIAAKTTITHSFRCLSMALLALIYQLDVRNRKLIHGKTVLIPETQAVKIAIITAIRFLAVALVYLVCFVVVSGALLSTTTEQPTLADAGATLLALLAVSLVHAAVWTYIIRRSRWSGWKLVMTVFLVLYGVDTLMPQIETAYFVTRLPPGMLPRLFIAGLIVAAIFAPLAVLILGKAKSRADKTPTDSRLNMPIGEWIAKLFVIAILYVFIYFTFAILSRGRARRCASITAVTTRQLLRSHRKSAAQRATTFSPSSRARFIVGRDSSARNQNDARQMVGSRTGSGPAIRNREFAIADPEPTDAARSANGPPGRNSDFQFSVWLVTDDSSRDQISTSADRDRLKNSRPGLCSPSSEPASLVHTRDVSIFRLIGRIRHHRVEGHEAITAGFKPRQYFVETISGDVVRVKKQRLRNVAAKNLRRDFLRKLRRRHGEVQIRVTNTLRQFLVAFLQRQHIANVKEEVVIINRMRRDFVPALGEKLLNRFLFLTRVAGVRHRVAKVKLIRAPRLHQLPRHNFAFRNFFLKLFDCQAVEIRVEYVWLPRMIPCFTHSRNSAIRASRSPGTSNLPSFTKATAGTLCFFSVFRIFAGRSSARDIIAATDCYERQIVDRHGHRA